MNMQIPPGNDKRDYVKRTFSSIASKYRLMNHLMTAFQDHRWRKIVIQLAEIKPGSKILDLGTGTGDLAVEALRQYPENEVIAADLTLEMMGVSKDWNSIKRVNADALDLPFQDEQFDVVVSGFLLRNVVNIETALKQQHRVLKAGGRLVVLDTTRPRRTWATPLVRIYFRYIIPFLGSIVSGNREAYTYLPRSTEGFVNAEEFTEIIQECGFSDVMYLTMMFGTIAIHCASKKRI